MGRRPPVWAAYRQLPHYAYADLILPYKTEPYATDGNTYLDERRVSPILERRYYEMTNHLGNVQATLLEYRTSPVGAGAFVPLSAVTYGATLHILSEYTPRDVLVTICDEKDNYRFGYNGMEKDNEVKGIANGLDFGARIYDSRLGKFLSLDPLSEKNPGISPYAFATNNPIALIDRDGEEPTLAAYKKAAEKLGVPVASIRSVYKSEVGRNAYFSGKAKICYERHYFSRLTGGKFDQSHPNISNPTPGGYGTWNSEYSKLDKAIDLAKNAAYMSASYGGFQIMGENYIAAGFSSPEDMYKALTSDNEDVHLKAFTNFVLNDKSVNYKKGVTMTKLEALKAKNWTQFAKGYNGPMQKGYDNPLCI